MTTPDLLVAGAPLVERVHRGNLALAEPGGAALRAALGAFLAGVHPALVGRWPAGHWTPLRNSLAARIDLGACPEVSGTPGEHRLSVEPGGMTLNEDRSVGLESLVGADDIPAAWRQARALLITPLGAVTQQLAFLRKTRASTQIPLIGAVCPAVNDRNHAEAVALAREGDLFFASLADACALADGEDVVKWLADNCRWSIIDLEEAGWWLIGHGRSEVHKPVARPCTCPFGALPALAGALLGGVALGRPIEEAARQSLRAAEVSSSAVGLEPLLAATADLEATGSQPRHAVPALAPVRAAIPDYARIARLARTLSGGDHPAFTFHVPAENFPPIGYPGALEFFFAVVLHQYGFWHLENGTWAGSLYAPVDGIRLKGSDFVFRSATKAFLAGEKDYTKFLDDTGSCPLPMADTHAELAAGFRAWAERNPPASVVADANASGRPVERLLELIADCPGYSGDPYRKKAMLLAMTLANRPEKWLRRDDGGALTGWGPVVDYHIQRTSLRTGCVLPLDESLRRKLVARAELTAAEEDSVRRATFEAMEELSRRAGMSHAAIDYLFFQARRLCPENREESIDCAHCPLETGCAKQKRLFQPVHRTTAY